MKYTTGSGQKMHVHDKADCNGEFCTIHNPSLDWPTHWRGDLLFMEYTCKCGVGYPAPEDVVPACSAYGTCGNKECLDEYQSALAKVHLKHGPRHYYDCDNCRFNVICQIGCPCTLVHTVTLPDPPKNVIDKINAARKLRGGQPYNPETGL